MRRKLAAAKAAVLLTAVTTCALALALTGIATAHHEGDHHGFPGSLEPAGTIASFDPSSGMLTIDLTKGGSVSGTVTDRTWIDCGGHGWDFRRHRERFAQHFGEDDQGWHHHWGWEHHSSCSTEDLTQGRTVDDAVLGLFDGGAAFWKIDLAPEEEEPTEATSG
jgi:hypothetical protein